MKKIFNLLLALVAVFAFAEMAQAQEPAEKKLLFRE